MKIGLRGLAVLVSVVVIGSLAMAQGERQNRGDQDPNQGQGRQGRGQFGRQMGGQFVYFQLLRMPDVQQELKLTDEQKKKVEALAPAGGPGRRGGPGGPGGGGPGGGGGGGFGGPPPGGQPGDNPGGAPGGAQGGPPPGQNRGAEQMKALAEILKPEQMARLKELALQFQGAGALAQNQELQRDLGLSEDQVTKIRDIQRETMQAMREEFQGGGVDREEMQKMMQDAQKEVGKKAEKVLTGDQKAKFDKMKGKAFTFKNTNPRGGGGAPGPGGGGF